LICLPPISCWFLSWLTLWHRRCYMVLGSVGRLLHQVALQMIFFVQRCGSLKSDKIPTSRMSFSGMWRREILYKPTFQRNVSPPSPVQHCSHLLTLVPRPRIFSFSSTLRMEAIRSSETSVYIISTRRHIPEYGFLHSHRRENL
jgi:hypothetical protein